MKTMAYCLHHIFVLCSLWITSTHGSLTMDMLMNRSVIITGPQNVTVFMRTPDTVIVAWILPQVYVPHDASDEKFEKLKNGDKIGVLKPLFTLEPEVVEKLKNNNDSDASSATANSTSSDETAKPSAATPTQASGTNEKVTDDNNKISAATPDDKNGSTAGSDDQNNHAGSIKDAATAAAAAGLPSGVANPTAASENEKVASDTTTRSSPVVKREATDDDAAPPAPAVNLNHVICKALTQYSDYTVSLKEKLALSDNGWAVSLLESDADIPVTDMSMFYKEKDHKVVKFQEGCITKITVTYSRQDTMGEERQIVLNATNHLAVLDNLKAAVNYKVVVTSHFVSGHAISARAIYVTTLLTGAYCRCDWHGTVNHTSDCLSPSPTAQHCGCNKKYAGRFCEACAEGFYREREELACKECPCGQYGGLKSSCRFQQQGFLTCDQCSKGYTGTVCHKCANGYFRFRDECRECHCSNNTKPDSPNMCHPTTGNCNDCQYNTTGFYCERCLSGYSRYPPEHTGDCFLTADVRSMTPPSPSSSHSGVSSGMVGAIVLVIVLCVCVVVGLCVIRKVRANRQHRALWTVEMRPDNDDLDFNSVHNEDARMDQVDDMAFYDRQTGRTKAGGKYSKLHEEI